MVSIGRKNILILEPERDTAELFTRAIETHSEGCRCYSVNTPQQARSMLSEMPFNFLLADISALQQDHFLLLDSIHEMGCRTLVIVHAYINERENIKRAMELGATGYFIKPIMVSSLRRLIDAFSVAGSA